MPVSRYISGAILMLAASICTAKNLPVTITNDLPQQRTAEMVELNANDVLKRIGSKYCYVTGPDKKEIPSQITHDGKLIFQVSVPGDASVTYTIHSAKKPREYSKVSTGRVFPERLDDMGWENDLIAYRAYGPALQANGEKGYGYDVFLKHPNPTPMLDKLYALETNQEIRARAREIGKTDKKKAQKMLNDISYHIDHGEGMDCYAVGSTLGAGVAAVVKEGKLQFPWCYKEVEILDNGPLRMAFTLKFDNNGGITERRKITLDAGSHLNHGTVAYEGYTTPQTVAAGVPRRDDAGAFTNAQEGYLGYSDPTTGKNNGRALMGVVMERADSINEAMDHILAYKTIKPGETLDYYFGFAWDKTDITDLAKWEEYLRNFVATKRNPLKIKY
ncbi:MAG: DUF4861 family protein [Muribaculaceae bacterium]|nr:DUF4861 family protein [Muribaculaceae bacterium]